MKAEVLASLSNLLFAARGAPRAFADLLPILLVVSGVP
jgi:hypothetical protein